MDDRVLGDTPQTANESGNQDQDKGDDGDANRHPDAIAHKDGDAPVRIGLACNQQDNQAHNAKYQKPPRVKAGYAPRLSRLRDQLGSLIIWQFGSPPITTTKTQRHEVYTFFVPLCLCVEGRSLERPYGFLLCYCCCVANQDIHLVSYSLSRPFSCTALRPLLMAVKSAVFPFLTATPYCSSVKGWPADLSLPSYLST